MAELIKEAMKDYCEKKKKLGDDYNGRLDRAAVWYNALKAYLDKIEKIESFFDDIKNLLSNASPETLGLVEEASTVEEKVKELKNSVFNFLHDEVGNNKEMGKARKAYNALKSIDISPIDSAFKDTTKDGLYKDDPIKKRVEIIINEMGEIQNLADETFEKTIKLVHAAFSFEEAIKGFKSGVGKQKEYVEKTSNSFRNKTHYFYKHREKWSDAMKDKINLENAISAFQADRNLVLNYLRAAKLTDPEEKWCESEEQEKKENKNGDDPNGSTDQGTTLSVVQAKV